MTLISTTQLLQNILEHIKEEKPLHASLPNNGYIKIDKPVPFIVVYRIPPDGKDGFTAKLGRTESAYLYGSDSPECDLSRLILAVSKELSAKFNGFLLLEVWLSEKTKATPFTVHVRQKSGTEIGAKLQEELAKIKIHQDILTADLDEGKSNIAPPYYKPLVDLKEASKSGITLIGLEISPVYINQTTGNPFPLLLRDLRIKFSKALRKSFFEFIRTQTSYNASNFQMLGTTHVDRKVMEVDKELGTYSDLFDFLLLVTPVNNKDAWTDFLKSKYRKQPVFHYRPMPIDPELVKRKLYDLPIEDISDPTLAFLFRDKRKEIDRMMNMMLEREKPDFLLSSLQLFGPIDEQLLEVAKALLVAIEKTTSPVHKKKLDATAFGALAEKELKWLQKQDPKVATAVRIADDIEGVFVSRGILNISTSFEISEERAFSLLQHEVGTHVVTYYNGRAQPFRLFYIGVPGYEELQEGMAVFAEYLTGGLTYGRMRTLAARVVAVHNMVAGEKFTHTYALLTDKYHFEPGSAFNIAMRVYRGGGLTKDAVYLKGLLNIIEYIKKGHDIKPLLIGKIRQDYLPVIEELIHRQILKDIPIVPKYLHKPYLEKIEVIRKGGNIFKMMNA
jgi:uncharacterized protein (TIGR02421 family)